MVTQHIDTIQTAAIIVLGIGGAGCNAIIYLQQHPIVGVAYSCIDKETAIDKTNMQPIAPISAGLHLYRKQDTKLVFIIAGFGSETSYLNASYIANYCISKGIIVIAFVYNPFAYEAEDRKMRAATSITKLEKLTDLIYVIENERLRLQHGNLQQNEVFEKAEIAILDIITDIVTISLTHNFDIIAIKKELVNDSSVGIVELRVY